MKDIKVQKPISQEKLKTYWPTGCTRKYAVAAYGINKENPEEAPEIIVLWAYGTLESAEALADPIHEVMASEPPRDWRGFVFTENGKIVFEAEGFPSS